MEPLAFCKSRYRVVNTLHSRYRLFLVSLLACQLLCSLFLCVGHAPQCREGNIVSSCCAGHLAVIKSVSGAAIQESSHLFLKKTAERSVSGVERRLEVALRGSGRGL